MKYYFSSMSGFNQRNRIVGLGLGLIISLFVCGKLSACSVVYYVDKETGKIFLVNNEDFWYHTKAYIQIEPSKKNELARLWYGWDDFAQGGINEKGLFFDAAVTPIQPLLANHREPSNNIGDKILAHCANVDEALKFIKNQKIAFTNSHLMFGDKNGNAVVVEWIDGNQELHWIKDNHLVMTNFLLGEPEAGNHPCPRYDSIIKRIETIEAGENQINLNLVGNLVGQAVQLPTEMEDGKTMGTLYTSFIDITYGKLVFSYKLSNENLVKLDLQKEFSKSKARKIKLR